MAPPSLTPLVTRLVDVLVACADRHLRDRILLDAVLAGGASTAAAIWRRADERGGWACSLARGDARLLPSGADVARVADADRAWTLAPDRRVLVAGDGLALALGGVAAWRVESDALEAVLAVWASIEEVEALVGGAGDGLGAALPRPRPGGDLPNVAARRLTHDLRNTLAGIQTTREVLDTCDDLSADEEVHFSAVLERECRRAGDLLRHVLAGGSPGERARRRGATSGAVVRDVVEEEARLGLGAGVAIELEIEPGFDGAPTRLDELGWERVARNLIVNAREALAREGGGGRIAVRGTVRVDETPGVVLVVSDDGPGIEPAILDRVFDPDCSTKPGGGCGLAVVRELAEAAGGWARAGCSAEGGARVEVRVALAGDAYRAA